jgi:hypothetical protein
MSVELGHEALAECHDFAVGFALGIEVGAALAAADGKAGQGVLEDLLEAEELDDAEVYGRMEAKTSLVRADGAVKLDTVTVVNLNLTLVVYPRYTEQDLALGGCETLKQSLFSVLVLVGFDHDAKGLKDFLDCLMELGLCGVLRNHSLQDFINI